MGSVPPISEERCNRRPPARLGDRDGKRRSRSQRRGTTMNAVMTPKCKAYRAPDISQAASARREIAIAETEMPGLMALRAEFGNSRPLAGARIAGSLHMTIQTAVLIETLAAL